jgi:DNA-binding NarL/FixJ family response regulator
VATRVIIADDHDILRAGVKKIVDSSDDMTVVDEAVNGQELLNKIRSNDYDVVVLDISMPGRDGLDVLTEIKSIRPKLSVLVLSSFSEEIYALRAYKSGASGYMSKRCSFQELLDALHKIASGKKYVSADMAESLVSGLGEPEMMEPHRLLSNREFQVMILLGSGKPVGRIASELALSVKTVSTYRTNILLKMNMKNNAELTRYVIENRLS